MYSSEIEKMFKQATENGLFKTDYPILALVYGYEILIKATPFEGIEIYSDYPGTKEFAVMHDGASLEGFGTGFTALELTRLMKALVEKTATDGLVIDHDNGPGVPLSRERFREICQQTSSRKIASSPFLNLKRTLDQWFATKVK